MEGKQGEQGAGGGRPAFYLNAPQNCHFYLRQGLTFRKRVWYYMGSRLNDYFRSLLNEVRPMVITARLSEVQRVEDALQFLLTVRAPVVVGDLNLSKRTWRGQPLNKVSLSEVAESLTEQEKTVVNYSALLIQWGRQYERNRLMWGDEDDDDEDN
jgi:hypothetical protein